MDADTIYLLIGDTTVSEELVEMVLDRLESFGITTVKDFALAFSIKQCEMHFRTFCNLLVVPESLYTNLCDASCAAYLRQMYDLGMLDDFDFTQAVSTVKEGDTSITFSGESSETLFQMLISELKANGESDLVCYRKVRW